MSNRQKRPALFANTVLLAALVASVEACEAPPQQEAAAPEPQVDAAQQFADLVAVDADPVALTGVKLIDGTGAAARDGQTVVIADGRVAAVGDDGAVDLPDGAEVLDLTGHTVMPGLIGLHNHSFYTAAGGPGGAALLQRPQALSGLGSDHHSHHRSPRPLRGNQPSGRNRGRARRRSHHLRHRTLPHRTAGKPHDGAAGRTRVRPSGGAILVRGGRELVQGVHVDQPSRAGRRDRGGPRPRHQRHCAPLLSGLQGGGGARDRQSGARPFRQQRIRSVQAAGRVSARFSQHLRGAGRQRPGRAADLPRHGRQRCVDDLDAGGLRDLRAGPGPPGSPGLGSAGA